MREITEKKTKNKNCPFAIAIGKVGIIQFIILWKFSIHYLFGVAPKAGLREEKKNQFIICCDIYRSKEYRVAKYNNKRSV